MSKGELADFKTLLLHRKKLLQGDVKTLEDEGCKKGTDAAGDLSTLPMHLAEIKRRPDIVFVRPGATPVRGEDTFAATAEMRDQPGPTVRIALHEAGVRQDNVALGAASTGERVYHAVEHIAIIEIGIQRLLCRLAVPPVFDSTYCPGDRGLIFRRTFAYGWQVHRLVRQAANAATIRHGG